MMLFLAGLPYVITSLTDSEHLLSWHILDNLRDYRLLNHVIEFKSYYIELLFLWLFIEFYGLFR